MSLIEVRALSKRFRTPKKAPGMAGAIKHLFRPSYEDKMALNGVYSWGSISIPALARLGYAGALVGVWKD